MSARACAAAAVRAARRVGGSLIARSIVTVGLLAIIATRLNWRVVEQRVAHGQPAKFVLAVGLMVLALTVGAIRWRVLLAVLGVSLTAAQLARVYWVSTFSGTFLPSTLGADVTRSVLVSRRRSVLGRVAMSIVVDRYGGLLGLLGIAWIAYLVGAPHLPYGAIAFLGWVTLVTAVSTGVIVGYTLLSRPGSPSYLPATAARWLAASRGMLASYLRAPVAVALMVVLSLAFQALVAGQVVMLAQAIEVPVSFTTAAVAVTIVTVVTLIPISIGGFGLREGTYVLLLAGASVSATDAVMISILTAVTLFVASLPGAVLLARRGLAPALSSGSEEPVVSVDERFESVAEPVATGSGVT